MITLKKSHDLKLKHKIKQSCTLFSRLFWFHTTSDGYIQGIRGFNSKQMSINIVLHNILDVNTFPLQTGTASSYSVWINIVVIGEALTGLLVTTSVTFISYMNYKNKFSKNSSIGLNDFIHINENFMNTNSDDEEIETYNKNKVQPMRQRSRSRTPTGTTQL